MKASLLLILSCFFQYSLSGTEKINVEIIGKIDDQELLSCEPELYSNKYSFIFKIPIALVDFEVTETFTMRLKNPNYIDATCTIYGKSSTQLKSDDSSYIYCQVDPIKFPIFYQKHGYIELPNSFSTETITFDRWGEFFGSDSQIKFKVDCFQPYLYEFTPSNSYETHYMDEFNITAFIIKGTWKKNDPTVSQNLDEDEEISISTNFLVNRDFYSDECTITKAGGQTSISFGIEGKPKQVQFFTTLGEAYDYYVLINASPVYDFVTRFNYSKFSGLFLVLLYLLL